MAWNTSSTERTGGQIEQRHRVWALEQPEVGLCSFCPDYRFTGTAREVAAAGKAHRLEAHPELNGRRRRRKNMTGQLLVLRQNLSEDEIAEIDIERARRMKLLGID